MAQQTRRWNPSDAANAFVRVILSDAGAKLGGLTEQEWARTLNWFDGRCAYTGEALLNDRTQRDHAIAMNRTHCGLHLYGNVLPATTEANSQKAGKHYRDFVEDPDRLAQIEAFVRESAYWDRVSVFGDLQRYCEAQYRAIDALCRVNRKYLASLLSEDSEGGAGPEPQEGDTLPITFDPPLPEAFKEALLRERRAWIAEVHRGWPKDRASLGGEKHVRVVERHREPAKPSAIPERCLAARRHPVANRFHPTTVTEIGARDEHQRRARRAQHAAGNLSGKCGSRCRRPLCCAKSRSSVDCTV